MHMDLQNVFGAAGPSLKGVMCYGASVPASAPCCKANVKQLRVLAEYMGQRCIYVYVFIYDIYMYIYVYLHRPTPLPRPLNCVAEPYASPLCYSNGAASALRFPFGSQHALVHEQTCAYDSSRIERAQPWLFVEYTFHFLSKIGSRTLNFGSRPIPNA